MSGIAGIAATGESARVVRMLDCMAHRGRAGRAVVERRNGTLGVVWSRAQTNACSDNPGVILVRDSAGPGHLAQAEVGADGLRLTRDQLGVAPLYYGRTADGGSSMPPLNFIDARFGDEPGSPFLSAVAAPIAPTNAELRILDVGCGTGPGLPAIFERAPRGPAA